VHVDSLVCSYGRLIVQSKGLEQVTVLTGEGKVDFQESY